MNSETQTKRAVRTAAALLFVVAGIAHFLVPDMLVRFIPPWLPAPTALVLISGVIEIAGGVGLFVARFRRHAAWMLSLLLLLILPANIFMLTSPEQAGVAALPALLLWARIAVLPLMIWGLLWCAPTRRGPEYQA